jgi:hypothetical protein
MSSAAFVLPSDTSDQGVSVRPLVEHRRIARPRLALVPPRPPAPAPAPPNVEDIRRLLTGVVEVLDGRRPASQLDGLMPCKYQRALVAEIRPGRRTLRSLHLSRTAPDVVDLCARVERLGRSRAIAGRLELRADRWRFTVLALV